MNAGTRLSNEKHRSWRSLLSSCVWLALFLIVSGQAMGDRVTWGTTLDEEQENAGGPSGGGITDSTASKPFRPPR